MININEILVTELVLHHSALKCPQTLMDVVKSKHQEYSNKIRLCDYSTSENIKGLILNRVHSITIRSSHRDDAAQLIDNRIIGW